MNRMVHGLRQPIAGRVELRDGNVASVRLAGIRKRQVRSDLRPREPAFVDARSVFSACGERCALVVEHHAKRCRLFFTNGMGLERGKQRSKAGWTFRLADMDLSQHPAKTRKLDVH